MVASIGELTELKVSKLQESGVKERTGERYNIENKREKVIEGVSDLDPIYLFA